MRNKNYFLLLIIFLSTNFSQAFICPQKSKAPLCPTSGSTLLDETYPTQAFVISNTPEKPGLESAKVTSEYISAVAKSYDYENIPQLLITTVDAVQFEQIKAQIKTNLQAKNIPADKVEKVLSQVTQVNTPGYTWQQDYFESFVDLKTGAPVLREFQSYIQLRPILKNAVAKIQAASSECPLSQGPLLPNHSSRSPRIAPNPKIDISYGNGEMGGNVEGAPGGICLTGNNQSISLAAIYCGKKENVIQLNTSWLAVGHVDEIFKIIPSNFNDGRPKDCQFSLMAASPQKALDLMGKSSNKEIPFNAFSKNLSADELKEIKTSRSSKNYSGYGNLTICRYIEEAIKNGSFDPSIKQNIQIPNAVKQVFINFLMSEGKADTPFNCAEYLDKIPNNLIKEALMKDNDIRGLNQAIQDSIDKDKLLIKTKILEKLPQCEKYFDVLDVPDLFYGASPFKTTDGKLTLANPGDAGSFLPNPTNSVLMNRTILLSESGNPVFDSYMEEELKKRQLNMEKIDTWDYAHTGQGNIHCASHSIPYCQPR